MCLAVPGEILCITGDDPLTRLGRVSFAGIIKQINLAFVPEARVGEFVLVHAGIAIGVVDDDEARRTIAYLSEGAPEVET